MDRAGRIGSKVTCGSHLMRRRPASIDGVIFCRAIRAGCQMNRLPQVGIKVRRMAQMRWALPQAGFMAEASPDAPDADLKPGTWTERSSVAESCLENNGRLRNVAFGAA